MMPDITPFLQLGAVGVVCYLLVWVVQRLQPIIENNTAVMNRIEQRFCGQESELAEHDQRAAQIGAEVHEINTHVRDIKTYLQEPENAKRAGMG